MVMSSIKPRSSKAWDKVLPTNINALHRFCLGSHCIVFGKALAGLRFTILSPLTLG